MVIRQANTGGPGCTHDARVLRNSSLFEDRSKGTLMARATYYCRQCLPPQKLAKYAIWEPQDNTGLTGDCRVLYRLLEDAMVI